MASAGTQQQIQRVIAELRELCRKTMTGRQTVNTSTNQFISIDLDKGRVVAIQCGPKKGREAIEHIASLDHQTTHFNMLTFMTLSSYNGETQSLPPNEKIFELLGGEGENYDLTAVAKDALQQVLLDYIGPIAMTVSRNVFASCHSIDAAIERLAAKIPDEDERKNFINEARQAVKSA